MIQIPPENIVNAIYVNGFTGTLLFWTHPKLTIICGNCSGQTKSRDYLYLHPNREICINCKFCGKWNKTNLYPLTPSP